MVTYVNRDVNLLYRDSISDEAALLIVTADDALRQTLRDELETHQVRAASTPEEVLAHCRYEQFVVLLDEDFDGYTLCRQIKTLNPTLPVIMLLNRDDDGVLEHVFEAGAVDYLKKSANGVALRHRVRQIMNFYALQAHENRAQSLLSLAVDYAYEMTLKADKDSQLRWITDGFELLTGYAPHELAAFPVHPDDEAKYHHHLHTVHQNEPHTVEFRIVCQNGEVRWIRDYAVPTGSAIHGFARDITTEKNDDAEREFMIRDLQIAVRQAEEANAVLDTIFTGASVGLAYFDRGLRFRRLNQALADINGVPIWEHLGNTPRDLLPDVEVEGTETMFKRVLETGEAVEFETSGYTHAEPKEKRYWLASYYPIKLREEILGIGAVIIDITARKHAEEELRYSTERLRAALKGSPVVVFSQDLHLRYTWMDFPYPGIETGQIIGQHDRDFMDDPEEAAYVETLKRRAIDEEIGLREEVRMHFNGKLYYFDLTIEPLRDEYGNIEGITCAAIDVTQRKRDQEMLEQQAIELQARNAELDAFSYTVAHDLKNPIASMLGFASLIQSYHKMMSDDDLLEHVTQIMEGAYKLRSIIDALLLLAGVNKVKHPDLEVLEMGQIIDGAKKRLTTVINETGAEIIVPDNWPKMVGYAPWVEEIIANYFSNALKYGGTPPRVEFGAEKVGKMVKVWVRDNGQGLTEEEQTRVFTPFTRLNQVKIEGHGLGLSIVERIVGKLGGQVGVESIVGQGSTFSFTLPTQK